MIASIADHRDEPGVTELVAERTEDVIAALADASSRYAVMVSITITPYQADDTEPGESPG
jgi:hypothetical protein